MRFWENKCGNALADIFLPWHPQTCAQIAKRKSAVELLLKEQPAVGWKLLLSLLPHMHGFTSGCRKPAWRQFIPAGWSDKVTNRDNWEQVIVYADLALGVATVDLAKLAELIDRFPKTTTAASPVTRTAWTTSNTSSAHRPGDHREFGDGEDYLFAPAD